MYGNKRIVIQKNNQIVLAGGGSWVPVGFVCGAGSARVLKEQYSRSEGFEEINASNKKALKEILNKKYNWIKEVA
jgi:hypothetical protein